MLYQRAAQRQASTKKDSGLPVFRPEESIMNDEIKVTVYRSDAWLIEQRAIAGRNIPDAIFVSVDPAALSLDTRRRLLEASSSCGHAGTFRDINRITYDQNYQPSLVGYGFSFHEIVIDSDAPTIAEIDAALADIFQRINEVKIKAEAKAEAEAEAKRRMDEAKELLKDALAEGKGWERDRRVLAEFLAAVPDDAMRGTLKRLAGAAEEIAALKRKIEAASPVAIFQE